MRVLGNQKQRSGGFSLVEALVALTIFGVGTIVLMQLAPRATQFANQGRLMSVANGLAQSKVEELKGLQKSHSDLQAGVHLDPLNPIDDRFERRWEVFADDPIQGMKRVEVRVRIPTASRDSVAALVTYF